MNRSPARNGQSTPTAHPSRASPEPRRVVPHPQPSPPPLGAIRSSASSAASLTPPPHQPQTRIASQAAARPGRGSPQRAYSPVSREGRLTNLVENFRQHSLKTWATRLSEIEQRQIRSRLLTDDDEGFLRSINERNRNFMRTIESVLKEAVNADKSIENSVVSHAFAAWKESNELQRRINLLLDERGPKLSGRLTSPLPKRKNSPSRSDSPLSHHSHLNLSTHSIASSKQGQSPTPQQPYSARVISQLPRSNSPFNRSSPAGSHRAPSPSSTALSERGRSPSRSSQLTAVRVLTSEGKMSARLPHAAPSSFQEIDDAALCKRRGSPVRTARPTASMLSEEDRRSVLEGLHNISHLRFIEQADLEWAQSAFHRLYGDADAANRFRNWLADVEAHHRQS
jgi:hypothetical protein